MEFITNIQFGKMINASAQILKKNAEYINKLNVFPVPDGDTGTNMTLTMQSGAQYERNSTDTSIGSLAQAFSQGLLMGARGNSGVILSQIMHGFTNYISNFKTLNARQFSGALKAGAESAYKSVMEPTEGTILTVIRKAAEAADKKVKDTQDIISILRATWYESSKTLKKTPDLLPVLKKVGVVDSGGQGLVLIFKAWYEILSGKKIKDEFQNLPDMAEFNEKTNEFDAQVAVDPNDIKYTYCTTILLELNKGTTQSKKWNYNDYSAYLKKLGDSLLIIADNGVVKTHVHTENPGAVLTKATQYGSIKTVKIDNMRDQQQAVIDKVNRQNSENVNESSNMAVIAVANGKGLGKLFKSMGVSYILPGGQTMNPSTRDFLNAISSRKTKRAIILPNNSNIFMAAAQASKMAKIPVGVVKTKTIQQGLTSLLGFNPEVGLKENIDNMSDQLDTVKSAEITTATRDTKINNFKIKKGEFMALLDGKITSSGKKVRDVALSCVENMLDKDSEIVTIIFGSDSNRKNAQKLAKSITKMDHNLETEVHEGDQPVYPYLISVE